MTVTITLTTGLAWAVADAGSCTGIPGIFVFLLFITPYIDRAQTGVGKWFAKERLLANTIFLTFVLANLVFVIIGTFFRGPNWAIVMPW